MGGVRAFPGRENCVYNESGFTCKVPPGSYFMMGDNRDNSSDSREDVGYVPAENLEGRALFRFFSTDGSAHFWEVWKWPFAVRYSRILTLVK